MKHWRALDMNKTVTLSMGHMSYGNPTILGYLAQAKVVIGKYCSIAEEVTIIPGGDHRVDWVTTYPLRVKFNLEGANQDGHPSTKGDVIVGNDVWIAGGAKILSGVTIGDGAVIGANALVSKDVEPYSIVGGNPAKHIKYRFDEETISKLLEIKWWDWEDEKVKENVHLLCNGDIQKFLENWS